MEECFQLMIEQCKMEKQRYDLMGSSAFDKMSNYFAPRQLCEYAPAKIHRKPSNRIITLGRQFRGIYLTEREAHVALLLLKGCTSKESAIQMHLSRRTVEYYLGNIKAKMGVRKKSDLISLLLSSDFIKNMYFFTNNLPIDNRTKLVDMV